MILSDPQTGIDQIEIRFTYISNQGENKGSIQAVWNVRNNSNVTLREVLAGEAVFVFDDNAGNNHKGVTPANVIDDNERYFDFVQELLNQVVPRKRGVANFYTFLVEDGIFSRDLEKPENNTLQALYYLKEHFHIDNTSNAQWDFTKLMRDYNIPEAGYLTWTNRIVDKRTLVGSDFHDVDNLINGSGGADTGLYELYVNVVKRFVDSMIQEAHRYAGVAGNPLPTSNWKGRSGVNGEFVNNPGQQVAYSYGCKDNITEFNDTIANCAAEGTQTILNRENDGIQNNEYRGNVNQANCAIGNGNRKWSGLLGGGEQESGVTPFNRIYWAGIDCSGFIQRVVMKAKQDNANLGINVTIRDIATNSPGSFMHSSAFFTGDYTYFKPCSDENTDIARIEREKLEAKLHKGDLIRYSGHVTVCYSDRYGVSNFGWEGPIAKYDLIHAHGLFTYNNDFARKVMRTGNDIYKVGGGIKFPSGIGRIALWD